MNRREQEIYGFGASFKTRQNRASRVAGVVLVAASLGMLAGLLWAF